MIFNSLDSNYDWQFVRRFLVAGRQPAASTQLSQQLADTYQGQAWLYYRGRAALHEAVRLTGARRVLINGFSCYAVEQAIQQAGSQVVFADVSRGAFHFNLTELKKLHRQYPDLGAVVIQNTFGLGLTIKPLLAYLKKHDLYLIEDLAHCPQGQYRDGPAFGQVGDLTVLSFGRDKSLDVVSGGALIVRRRQLQAKVTPPQPLKGHYRQRFTDRVYPLFISLVRAVYERHEALGKAGHQLASRLGLLPQASDGLVLSQVSLPSYRSRFVLEQLQNLDHTNQRRRHLAAIYEEVLFDRPETADNLLRYPVVLRSATLKNLFLDQAQQAGFYLADIWYDSSVYPRRFMAVSSYQAGTCRRKEKLHDVILNLPLHAKVSAAAARRLATILKPYLDLELKIQFTDRSWSDARRQIKAQTYNLLTSPAELQAWRAVGATVHQAAFSRHQQLLGLTAAVVINARRARFLKVAGSPLLNSANPAILAIILNYLKWLARREGCAFIRMQPCWPDRPGLRRHLRRCGFEVASANLNAQDTLKIDLTAQSLDELWTSVPYRKTRSRVRRARRSKLVVEQVSGSAALQAFLKLLQATQARQAFVPNEDVLIKAQFEAYQQAGKLKLYQASLPRVEADPEILAMTFIVVDDCEITDLYGAASKRGLRLYAAYLLKWQIIKEAYKDGVQLYNLWGAAPPQAGPDHKFAGFTIFKKNFGGRYVSYLR